MGRKKIAITRIQDERNRQITFSKRKAGLLKKAYELSILCDCEIAVIMMTNNRKLYQYASSNMNSILIRYTEFKDPDESKTNADILEDIQKKEKGAQHGDDSGEEEETSAQSFMLTPRTQAQYRKIDEEFDHMLQHNPMPSIPGALHGGHHPVAPPQVMPVTVPVTQSPGVLNQQIQQHLQQQMEMRANSANSTSSSGMSSLISPQSDMSASPSSAKGKNSPTSMPPPVGTPTRLQTLRNQTLKLHLPGSGRNYISLGPGSAGSTSPGRKGGGGGGENGEVEVGGGAGGNKPHLRVMIPGQKGFVPRTQATSPLPQMELTNMAVGGGEGGGGGGREEGGGGGGGERGGEGGGGSTGAAATVHPTTTTTAATTAQTSTHSDSLTTPVLSLATPNLLSSLPPPLFSSLTGDFPFSALMSSGLGGGGGAGGGGGGGGGNELSSALVAFPVSIQPSTSGPNTNPGNIVLQAQNMGQPFLLTPNIDPRQNSFLTPQTFTPPASSLSPNMRDLEQLKQQYERVQQQLLQQQLFISQQLQQQHQEASKGGAPSSGAQSTVPQKGSPPKEHTLSKEMNSLDKPTFNTADVLVPPQKGSEIDVDTEPTPSKRPRLTTSSDQST